MSSSLSVCAVPLLTVTCPRTSSQGLWLFPGICSQTIPCSPGSFSTSVFVIIVVVFPHGIRGQGPQAFTGFFFSPPCTLISRIFIDFCSLSFRQGLHFSESTSFYWELFFFKSSRFPNLNSPCAKAQDMISLLLTVLLHVSVSTKGFRTCHFALIHVYQNLKTACNGWSWQVEGFCLRVKKLIFGHSSIFTLVLNYLLPVEPTFLTKTEVWLFLGRKV